MKKYKIFYMLDAIGIILCLILAIKEELSSQTGLAALESAGRFALFSGLSIIGVIAFIIVVIIQLIVKKKQK